MVRATLGKRATEQAIKDDELAEATKAAALAIAQAEKAKADEEKLKALQGIDAMSAYTTVKGLGKREEELLAEKTQLDQYCAKIVEEHGKSKGVMTDGLEYAINDLVDYLHKDDEEIENEES